MCKYINSSAAVESVRHTENINLISACSCPESSPTASGLNVRRHWLVANSLSTHKGD